MTTTAIDSNSELLARAQGVIAAGLVWDNHSCMPLRPGDYRFLEQLDRVRAAGIDVVCLNIGFGPQSLESHLRMLASFRSWLGARPERFSIARNLADIDQAKADGKLAIVFDVEGMHPLDDGDDGLVEMMWDLGVRWMLVAYNRNNAAGGGCYDDDPGLSAHGRRVLVEMKRVGMVVCCSHTGHRTAFEVLSAADNPVIFSHSNPSSVYPHARNISDDLIRACASTGGVVGINGIGIFLGDNDNRPETLVRHIDRVVELVGVDHVGISLDYVFDEQEMLEYLQTMRETFPDEAMYRSSTKMVPPEALVAITAGLCGLGYSNADLFKILGENWRRVAQQVWK